MDGDHTAKSFEQGANSALKENEMSSGIHESVNQTVRSCIPHAEESANGVAACSWRKDTGNWAELV